MASHVISPFKTHLTFYSTTPTPAATSARPQITLLSGLRRSLALGLNFPLAVLSTIGLRLLYGNPWRLYLQPVDIQDVKAKRTMLEDVPMSKNAAASEEIIRATRASGKGLADVMHVRGLCALASDINTMIMGAKELEACKRGELLWLIEERHKFRDGPEGQVLPFSRGGPIS